MNEKMFLSVPTEQDTALREYIKRDSSIADIRLVHNEMNRRPNTWTAIAVKFNKKLSREKVVEKVVELHADEYWGKSKGYHIFWWD